MDPATIGLLISMAPTVLDLLFGEGHIKESLHPQRISSKNMLAYGLEGYGEGYRYPPLTGPYVVLPYETSSGKVIQKAIQVPSKKWAAAYFLNKKAVAHNDWVNFMRSKMDDLRKEYYTKIKGKKPEEVPERIQRIRHKLMLEAIKRIPELATLEGLSEDDLIKLYYEGRVPPSKKLKERIGLQVLGLPKK
jgi:hypothetical protein